MRNRIAAYLWIMPLALLPLAAGCAAAVGAAAGAAAAIAYTERNASSEVAASVAQVTGATEAVFGEMGIVVTHRSASEDGREAELRGDMDGLAVTVEIEHESDRTTDVVVTVRRGELDYRPQRAGEILQRIIDRVS